MIFIYSFPRCGSSLLHRTLVNAFKFNSVFEPFGYMPEKLTDSENFNFVTKWFKGSPDANDLYKYKIKNYYIASIPEDEYTCKEVLPYRNELFKYFYNIYQAYGDNTVVKLVRQQSNFVFIHKILVEIGIKPKYIFLKRNPAEIVYSFYRGGFNHSFMNWYYKDLCKYREAIYVDNCYFRKAKTPIDYIMSSILSDYKSFDESYKWISKSENQSLIIHYEDFVANPEHVMKIIANDFLKHTETADMDLALTKIFDLSKLNSSRSDYFFTKKLINTIDRLKLEMSIPHVQKSCRYKYVRNVLFNNFVFHYPVRIFEALMRRIYWKTKWQFIKSFFNY